ncbi:10720_t:CDS:1, partial [Funneliformis geosporum]
ETNLVPFRRFSEKTDKDPNDWLIHFEKAAKANNWSSEKALEIVGGFLEGMAADWYEDTNFQSWKDPEEFEEDNDNQ